jgi:hypothetical protein
MFALLASGRHAIGPDGPGFGRPALFLDTLTNLVAGLFSGKDKLAHDRFGLVPQDRGQLDAAYRGDWIARKAIDVPAFDMTREWRRWHAAQPQIEAIEAEEARLGLQRKVARALRLARLYGGAALVLGIGDAEPSQPLPAIGLGGLRYLHVMHRWEIAPGEIDRDVLSPGFGEPGWYQLASTGRSVRLHPSRVVRLLGAELPDGPAQGFDGWGDSVLQAVMDAIRQAGLATQGVATLIHEAKLDVIRIPNLTQNLSQAEYAGKLSAAAALLPELMRSTQVSAETVVKSLLFIPFFQPNGNLAPVLGVGWTLNYEMGFYAVFAVLLGLGMRARVPAMALAFLALFILGKALGADNPFGVFLGHSITFEFVAGMALYLLHRQGLRAGPVQVAALLCFAVFVFGWTVINGPPSLDMRFFLWGLPAIAVVAAALSLPDVKGRLGRFLEYLGDASYSIYLSHLFVIAALFIVMGHFGIASPGIFVAVALGGRLPRASCPTASLNCRCCTWPGPGSPASGGNARPDRPPGLAHGPMPA